jgi:hypothetical protein
MGLVATAARPFLVTRLAGACSGPDQTRSLGLPQGYSLPSASEHTPPRGGAVVTPPLMTGRPTPKTGPPDPKTHKTGPKGPKPQKGPWRSSGPVAKGPKGPRREAAGQDGTRSVPTGPNPKTPKMAFRTMLKWTHFYILQRVVSYKAEGVFSQKVVS